VFRQQLHGWYGGGPAIRIPMIQLEQTAKRVPDLSPITLTVASRDPRSERESRIGILISRYTTDKELYQCVAEHILLGRADVEDISIKCRVDPTNISVKQINVGRSGKSMFDYGIKTGSVIIINDETRCRPQPCLYEEDKNGPFISDDEMLRLVIEQSLNDVPPMDFLEEEKMMMSVREGTDAITPKAQAEIPNSDTDTDIPPDTDTAIELEKTIEKKQIKTPSTG